MEFVMTATAAVHDNSPVEKFELPPDWPGLPLLVSAVNNNT